MQIPDEYKQSQQSNDPVWQKIICGPEQTKYQELDLNDIDTTVSKFAEEWFAGIQSIINMTVILKRLSDQLNDQGLVNGTLQIYAIRDTLVRVHALMSEHKEDFLRFAAMRRDWGSITAFNNGPIDLKRRWLQ